MRARRCQQLKEGNKLIAFAHSQQQHTRTSLSVEPYEFQHQKKKQTFFEWNEGVLNSVFLLCRQFFGRETFFFFRCSCSFFTSTKFLPVHQLHASSASLPFAHILQCTVTTKTPHQTNFETTLGCVLPCWFSQYILEKYLYIGNLSSIWYVP